jgi:hypothetical protein
MYAVPPGPGELVHIQPYKAVKPWRENLKLGRQ